MQTTRHLESAAMRTSAAVGAAVLTGLLALPVSAQSPTGIAGGVARNWGSAAEDMSPGFSR